MDRLTVCVTGGRGYDDYNHLCRSLNSLTPFDRLGVGDARGADAMARRWALEHGVPFFEFRANWQLHGRGAGPIRNRQMLEDMKPLLLVAFPGGAGTEDCIKAALHRGILVWRA